MYFYIAICICAINMHPCVFMYICDYTMIMHPPKATDYLAHTPVQGMENTYYPWSEKSKRHTHSKDYWHCSLLPPRIWSEVLIAEGITPFRYRTWREKLYWNWPGSLSPEDLIAFEGAMQGVKEEQQSVVPPIWKACEPQKWLDQ